MITLILDKFVAAELKAVLFLWRPDIGSSHSSQAIARGAGFRSHEALGVVLERSEIISPNSQAFGAFLTSRGHDADPNLIHLIFASVAVRAVAARYPRLTSVGFGLGEAFSRESPQARATQFVKRRNELFEMRFAEAFLRSHALLQRIPKTKSVRPAAHSYRMKHIAENLTCTYPDGSVLGPAYVPNGAFIAAAAHNGFLIDHRTGRGGAEEANAGFNMSKRIVDDLDAECRPDGAIGQLRAEQRWQRDRLAAARAIDAAFRGEWNGARRQQRQQ